MGEGGKRESKRVNDTSLHVHGTEEAKIIDKSKGHIPPCVWDRGGQRESKRVKDTSL